MEIQSDLCSVSKRAEHVVRDAIESAIEEIDYEDLVGLWLRTPQGRSFHLPNHYDKENFLGYVPNAVRIVANSLTPDLEELAGGYNIDSTHQYGLNLPNDSVQPVAEVVSTDPLKAKFQRRKNPAGRMQPEKTDDVLANELVDALIVTFSECPPEKDDSGSSPGNAWEEIVLQQQVESGSMSEYSRSLVFETLQLAVEQLSVFRLMALWLVTDQGRAWKGNGKRLGQDLHLAPVDPDDVVLLLVERFFARARSSLICQRKA